MSTKPLLSVRELRTQFDLYDHSVYAVNGVSFDLNGGEVLGIVGESGSGKTQLNMSIMRLIPRPGRVVGGSVLFQSRQFGEVDLMEIPEKQMRDIRGAEISMIFQDAMTALNPYMRVSEQMGEMLQRHKGMNSKEAIAVAIERLREVGIPEPDKRVRNFPHEFSGGQRQRVMIAMSLICDPQVVIADEPTTALDVTIQAQVLDVLRRLQKNHGTAIIFISHNLGVIAQLCHRVMVMYGGLPAEVGSTDEVFKHASHRYTHALMRSVPRLDETERTRLATIEGLPPSLKMMPAYCPFAPRCEAPIDKCRTVLPPMEHLSGTHYTACLNRAGGQS